MPKFSLFTPLGHLRFSREAPLGEQFFETGKSVLGTKSYDLSRGGRMFAWLYANAMAFATAKILLERARDQWRPDKAYEGLGVYEIDHGIVPHAEQGISERREEAAWRRKLLSVPSKTNIENELAERTEGAFLALITTAKEDAVSHPTNLGDSPMALARQTDRRAIARTLAPVSSGLATCEYEAWAEDVPHELRTGDVIVIGVGTANEERVTVLAADADDVAFNCAYPHSAGEMIVLGHWPYWTSTKRRNLVILTAEGAEDAKTRRRAHEVMERNARGTSIWDVGGANEDGLTAGPFKVGVGKLGVTPIGEFTL